MSTAGWMVQRGRSTAGTGQGFAAGRGAGYIFKGKAVAVVEAGDTVEIAVRSHVEKRGKPGKTEEPSSRTIWYVLSSSEPSRGKVAGLRCTRLQRVPAAAQTDCPGSDQRSRRAACTAAACTCAGVTGKRCSLSGIHGPQAVKTTCAALTAPAQPQILRGRPRALSHLRHLRGIPLRGAPADLHAVAAQHVQLLGVQREVGDGACG